MNRYAIIGIVAIIGVLVVLAAVKTLNDHPVQADAEQRAYTMSEVENATDCLTVVGDSVYNLTPFIGVHPGGPKTISRICNTNGTTAFEAKHGRNEEALEQLGALKVGWIG